MSLASFLVPLLLVAGALASILWLSNRESKLKTDKALADMKAAAEKKAADADRETLGRMADADAVSVTDNVTSARERMRKRNPKTR